MRVTASGYEDGKTPEPPTPTVYEQLNDALSEVKSGIDSLGSSAEHDVGEGNIPILNKDGHLEVSVIPPEAFDAVQSDWSETDETQILFIKNKPTKVSKFENDAGYLTAENDPRVPAWAKAAAKPTYDYSEIENTPVIPSELIDLTGILSIENGETGAATAVSALENLGASAAEHTHAVSDITSGALPIENGGTGAKTVTEAQSALKIFTDISQLNVDYPCSTGDIVNAMPAGSIGLFNVEASSCTVTDVATGFSFLEIYKATPNRVRVLLNGSPSDGLSTGSTFSIGQYNAATHTIESWKRIQTSAFATPINCGGTGATTASAALSNLGAVPATRTINSKALNSNIELTHEDVGAAAAEHTHAASDISSGALPIESGGTGAMTASAALLNLHGVEATTSAITYYISPSGSNSNSGISSSSPFKTLAYALSRLPKFLKHDVTINVAQGTYTESEVLITGFVGEGTLSIVGTAAANAVGAENYIFSNGILINKNQGRVEIHGIGSSNGFRVFNSPDVVFYYCHAYSPGLVANRSGFFATHSKVFTLSCRATNIQNGFHSYQGGDLTAAYGVCTNCSYPWCSGEGAVLYVYGASSSGFTSAHNYSSAGILVGSYGGTLGI